LKKKVKPKEKKPRVGKRPRRGADGGSRSTSELVSKVKETIEEKIAKKEIKPTIGDYIRLLQFEQATEEEKPKEIRVTWVEPSEETSVSET
jgi:hypothetical protein